MTTTTLTSSANPARVRTSVEYTASVAAMPPGGGTPSGNVRFYDGTKLVGTISLSGGQASLTVSYASRGRHRIKAVYVGNASYLTSSSAVLDQAIR
jgi:hypothetical protein